jgi:hypothetical protein
LESGFNPIFCLRIIQVSLKAENIVNVVGYIRCPIVLLSHLIFTDNVRILHMYRGLRKRQALRIGESPSNSPFLKHNGAEAHCF